MLTESEYREGGASMLDNKAILITGGTGSFGWQFTSTLLKRYQPRRLIIFSRDEFKQSRMRQVFDARRYPMVHFVVGDVRDSQALGRALREVDVAVHAAALKHIPATEINPLEAIKTNILGAANVIEAAIKCGVSHVIALSTDKAVSPINLYGGTKLCAEKLFTTANATSDASRFSVVRYGNVFGSRGSVVPLFLNLRNTGSLPVTDLRMTRFCITLDQCVAFAMSVLASMQGGEIFIPKLPSIKIEDLAKAIAPNCSVDVVGIRAGEKLHEVLIPEDDARHTFELDDRYITAPAHRNVVADARTVCKTGRICAEGFSYRSNTNSHWLSVAEIQAILRDFEQSSWRSAMQ